MFPPYQASPKEDQDRYVRSVRMLLSVFRYDIIDQQGFPWDQKEMKYNGTYYGFPTTLEENAVRAHEYLFGTSNYQVSDELGRINQKIINRVGS